MTKLSIYLDAERQRVKGNLAEAEALYRQALQLDANDWKLRECLAEVLYTREDVRGALKELFQAAHRLIWQGTYADATRLLQKMLRIDPKQEYDVTKGVQACLDEIAEAMKESSDELPIEADWASTREFLESLVLQDSSASFRAPEGELQAPASALPRRLTLALPDQTPVTLQGRELLVGRSRDCHMVLKEGVVSRHHSRLLEMDGHFFVQNWESKNGTFLNGSAVQSAELQHGDRIRFGLKGPEATVSITDAPGA